MARKQKKDLDKAYALYVKRAAEYGLDPKSKDEFRKRNFQTYRVKWSKKKNTNFQIAKQAIEKQMAIGGGGGYYEYAHRWKRAKKKGFIIATEMMPLSIFQRKREQGMTVSQIVGESYKVNMKQAKQLLREAKQVGIKMSLTDLLSQGKGYQALMKHIDEHGWETLLSWSYEEGTTRKGLPEWQEEN